MEIETSLTLFERHLQLMRYPEKSQHISWRAWDAADEYLIQHLEQQCSDEQRQSMLILNDDFGALSCWFVENKPSHHSDSYVAQQACKRNLKRNQLDCDNVSFVTSLQPFNAANLVIIKLPKSLALLEHQLIELQSVITQDTQIVAAGMVKHMAKSVFTLFEKYIGPVSTSLAQKKARLLFAKVTDKPKASNPYPTQWPLPNTDFTLTNQANVFAREQLDIGARVLLDALPNLEAETVIDLGCGNGVIGLSILAKYPNTRVIFVDESHMAVASARQNIENNLPQLISQCEFVVTNCLEGVSSTDVDLVLCNPPFHQQNTITDHIAWQMFSDAQKCLRKGGELRIVGNRHLDYPKKLKRLFGGYQVVHSSAKFSVLQTFKR